MTANKRFGPLFVKIFLIAAAAFILQLVLWNWSSWSFLLDGSVKKNVVYTLQDFQTQNWTEQDGQLISSHDPMLIRDGINSYIRQVQIELNANSLPPYVQIYYTDDTHPNYDGDAVIMAQPVFDTMVIDVNDDVQNLRIDLGDEPGTVLQGITVTVNPVKVHFSASIEVAVMLIYLGGSFLFSLQRAPDYGLSEMIPKSKEDDDA